MRWKAKTSQGVKKMRTREELEAESKSLPMEGFALMTELLLDIRDLLQLSEDRMVRMQTEFEKLRPQPANE